MESFGGRALVGLGPFTGYQTQINSECPTMLICSQTTGDKIRGRKGKSPDRQLRSLNTTQWKRKCDGKDSQEVGLEAATPRTSA